MADRKQFIGKLEVNEDLLALLERTKDVEVTEDSSKSSALVLLLATLRTQII